VLVLELPQLAATGIGSCNSRCRSRLLYKIGLLIVITYPLEFQQATVKLPGPRRSPGLLSAKLHTRFFKSGTYFAVRTDVTKACFPVLGVAQLPPMQHLGEG
jgi:hypothetical protein